MTLSVVSVGCRDRLDGFIEDSVSSGRKAASVTHLGFAPLCLQKACSFDAIQ